MKIYLWTILYVGAVLSALACFYIIYLVTITGDPSIEWITWVFFGLAVALTVIGFLYEQSKKGAGLPRPRWLFGKETEF